ncbi:DUF2177 family protein [Enterococcus caccae]|uniref:Integral membrane protein n=1 Tax=Enterococcus caccae ATCC BAA-1240 TaxID=1158612 RepID=R3TQ56_9ENTE|nr:DUF2177 family protein [Enterococcus caccae]EOL43243.1 hypothetical protein UC7_02572 [Enterococcus caccae ATCC BAA-1240]EOT68357.1 hypothetical protein I580_00740 [Enterococcus caccae ATCC BAA-1240]OJG26844.1 hypothetical protein RU98_GL003231 [Enterococcus caccae]
MNYFLRIFTTAALTFLVLDFTWLLLIARKIYQDQLGSLLGTTKIIPAAIFYSVYLMGMLFFVVYPALEKNSLMYALLAGAFLGLLCYATYDLTNLATIKNWPAFVTIIDLIWGAAVTATTCGFTVFVAQYFKWR